MAKTTAILLTVMILACLTVVCGSSWGELKTSTFSDDRQPICQSLNLGYIAYIIFFGQPA